MGDGKKFKEMQAKLGVQSTPKAKEKKPEPEEEEDDIGVPREDTKDPFAAFPKGTWNMDDFKRCYSNEDEDKSIAYFWEKFEKENYSIWFGESCTHRILPRC